MAQRTVVQLVDDIDGTQITGDGGETVTFALDGTTYEIDVTREHARQLRDAVEVYVANGRRVGGRRARATTPGRSSGGSSGRRDPAQTKAIKEWARANGHQISDRGRIAQRVLDAYEAAH